MVAKVALGHGVLNAVNSEEHYVPGRIILLAGGTGAGGTADDRYGSYAGYDGFGFDQAQASSDRLFGAVVTWLTGKASGANILLCTSGPPTSVGHAFGTEFQAGLTRNGHSFTIRGESTWNDSTWDPLDYDMACIQGYGVYPAGSYHGAVGQEDCWAYLLTHGGNVLSLLGNMPPWGFPATTNHWTSAAHKIDNVPYMPFDGEEEFGESEVYRFVQGANVSSTFYFPTEGDADFEFVSTGKYTALNNTHGGHAWVKTCQASGHTEEWAAAAFWTYE